MASDPARAARPAMVWRLTLDDRVELSVVADSTFVSGADQVFEIAVGDQPPSLLEVARVPVAVISAMTSEPAADPD